MTPAESDSSESRRLVVVLSSLCAEGTPVLTLALCIRWQQMGIEPCVVTLSATPTDLEPEFARSGIKVDSMSLPNTGRRRFSRMAAFSYRVCREFRPRALLSMPLGWHTLLALGARLAGVPSVVAQVGNCPSAALRAAKLLRDAGHAVEVWLIADGSRRSEYEALIAELGLANTVKLLGVRREIPERLGRCNAFAFATAPDEGQGVALVEAIAAEVPVVATDVRACREVLPDIRHVIINIEPGRVEMREAFLSVPGVKVIDVRRLVVHAGNPPPLDSRRRRLWKQIVLASRVLRVAIESCSLMVYRELCALAGSLPPGSEVDALAEAIVEVLTQPAAARAMTDRAYVHVKHHMDATACAQRYNACLVPQEGATAP